MYDPVQYFDEMNILKDDKFRRINTAKEFINALVDFFAAQFMNCLLYIFSPGYSFTRSRVLIMKMSLWIFILPWLLNISTRQR